MQCTKYTRVSTASARYTFTILNEVTHQHSWVTRVTGLLRMHKLAHAMEQLAAVEQGPHSVLAQLPIFVAIYHMHSTAAGIGGTLTCLLRPRLLPASAGPREQAGDQPAQPVGDPPAAACPTNATAHIAAGLHVVFERVSAARAAPDSWRTAVLVLI
jgi:hypothetical protein